MTPRRDTLVLGGLSLGAAALVVLGLLTVGGPQTARAERRDQARLSDLHQLVSYVSCVSAQSGEVLPEALSPTIKACAEDPPLSDRFGGAPYGYEPLSATSYRLCATFERPERLMPSMGMNSAESFEPSTGCLTVILPR